MKNFWKTLLFCLLAISLLMASAWVSPMAGGDAPSLEIAHYNLSLEGAVYIEYAVSLTGINPAQDQVKMLYWTAPQEEYTEANADSSSRILGYTEIDQTTYYVFKYTELSAKQMTDVIYSRAYAKVGENEYYSALSEYSIVEYASRKLGLKEGYTADEDEHLKAMLRSMLAYGASAQQYFHYKTDDLATDLFLLNVVFDSNGGSAVPTQKLEAGSKVQEPAAPTKEGYTFGGWEYMGTAWNFDTSVNGNMTLVAKWSRKVSSGLAFSSGALMGIGTCTDTDIVMPDCENEVHIEQINKGAFSSNQDIRSFAVGKYVTTISDRAFYSSSLETVTLSSSVNTIKAQAFAETDLTEIVFPENCSLGTSVCMNCTSLTRVILPKNISGLSGNEFSGCTSLSEVWIPRIEGTFQWDSLPIVANGTIYFEGNETNWESVHFNGGDISHVTVIFNSPRPAN